MDQISQQAPRSAAAAAPPQVQRPGGSDRTRVVQLPDSLSEKPGVRSMGSQDAGSPPTAAVQGPLSAPSARRAGSVDADEIARLLDRGEAASIDAAAAIASGVAAQAPPQDPEGVEGADGQPPIGVRGSRP